MTLIYVQLHSRVLKAATMTKTDYKLEESWSIILMLKSLFKEGADNGV